MAQKITCENSEEKIKLLEEALKRGKQAEESLRVSEHQFRQIYEHTQVGIAYVSLDFVIERANPAYCRMLGYTEEELRGKHLKDITHPEVIEENLRKQAQLGRGEIDHYVMEKKFIHKQGHTLYRHTGFQLDSGREKVNRCTFWVVCWTSLTANAPKTHFWKMKKNTALCSTIPRMPFC